LLAVRQEPAGLQRVNETRRRLLTPGVKDLRRGQAIKRVIHLHRVEKGAVIGEPPLHREARGVKGAAPVPVNPAGRADMNISLREHAKPRGCQGPYTVVPTSVGRRVTSSAPA